MNGSAAVVRSSEAKDNTRVINKYLIYINRVVCFDGSFYFCCSCFPLCSAKKAVAIANET